MPSLHMQEQLSGLLRKSLSTKVGFWGKITYLRQTLRQHVPRLNWKQSLKGMKRSGPFTGMRHEANKFWKFVGRPKIKYRDRLDVISC